MTAVAPPVGSYARTPADVVRGAPHSAEAPAEALTLPVTPVEGFFVRTNFDVPVLDAATHRVALRRADGSEAHATIAELRALGTITTVATMECAGNSRAEMVPLPKGETWRRRAVSTGAWTGVPLARVVEAYGLSDGAAHLLFRGADGGTLPGGRRQRFERWLSRREATEPGPLVAFEMNGEPLPTLHGGPVRLVVPGWYGMASVKWLTDIEGTRVAPAGYFQTERYVYQRDGLPDEPVREIRVKSMITAPDGTPVPAGQPFTLRGWAWSGVATIARVDVALAGDAPWQAATLGPQPSRFAWRPWSIEVTLPQPGHYLVRCRATDASGATQPEQVEWNALGYGNNAIQVTSIVAA